MDKIKVALFKVRLDRGGYESTGVYYGIGEPLYRYEYTDGDYFRVEELRAPHREAAKEKVRKNLAEKGITAKIAFYN